MVDVNYTGRDYWTKLCPWHTIKAITATSGKSVAARPVKLLCECQAQAWRLHRSFNEVLNKLSCGLPRELYPANKPVCIVLQSIDR